MSNWREIIISGSDAELNKLNVDSSLTASGLIYPAADGSNTQVLQTDGSVIFLLLIKIRDLKVLQAQQVLKVQMVKKEKQGKKVLMVKKENKDQLVLKEKLEHKVYKEKQVKKVKVELKVQMETKVLKVLQEDQV